MLDQLALRFLVALVLAPRELALLGRGQQPTVADLADVELERILRRRRGLRDVVGVLFFDVGGLRNELQLRLGGGFGEMVGKRPLLHRAGDIGLRSNGLESVNPPTEGARFGFCNRRAKLC